ncbi:hypothetical protein BDZ89DRAFT_1142314 [Hymenopellis radicata]|nr:hypothetical protein BDZ89DRAFT_1142314 [Hymenopellis radicata]
MNKHSSNSNERWQETCAEVNNLLDCDEYWQSLGLALQPRVNLLTNSLKPILPSLHATINPESLTLLPPQNTDIQSSLSIDEDGQEDRDPKPPKDSDCRLTLGLHCSWCARDLSFSTVNLTGCPMTFCSVWILPCGHYLDTYCLWSILLPTLADRYHFSKAVQLDNGDIRPVFCSGKVFNCNVPDCGKTFSIVARFSSASAMSYMDSRLWTFESADGRSLLTPFAAHFRSFGTLQDLYDAGYGVKDLITRLPDSAHRRGRPVRDPVKYVLQYL